MRFFMGLASCIFIFCAAAYAGTAPIDAGQAATQVSAPVDQEIAAPRESTRIAEALSLIERYTNPAIQNAATCRELRLECDSCSEGGILGSKHIHSDCSVTCDMICGRKEGY